MESPNGGNATITTKKHAEPNAPACIIIEPTKELAEQTNTQIETFKKYLEKPSIRFGLDFCRLKAYSIISADS